ncbi:hypothetical protein [Faecalibacillus faecis]|jgi:hypothetical protein|uniref:Uncharacterized protein n=1 Tax=Faecalibacillus faecis TaxID=1982628 RepID=A0AAW4VMU5_9FIRM|nr:hypothetical protein [Faecalibacillus faecis]MBS5416870.1 hypothetical protein [Coprobacillus sp.]MCB8568329.1 hypothetical protein [Faecalibacillus faecis]MCB8610407.1 hypothetical protein [Faecalibacillus faecis]MCQ5200510.1 hypothetical protein [Faecalibacillus faecis]
MKKIIYKKEGNNMILDELLRLIKPVGKIFLVDKKGNSLAKINASEIELIQEYKNKEVTEIYSSNITEGMNLFSVFVIEIKI